MKRRSTPVKPACLPGASGRQAEIEQGQQCNLQGQRLDPVAPVRTFRRHRLSRRRAMPAPPSWMICTSATSTATVKIMVSVSKR